MNRILATLFVVLVVQTLHAEAHSEVFLAFLDQESARDVANRPEGREASAQEQGRGGGDQVIRVNRGPFPSLAVNREPNEQGRKDG